MSLSLNIAIVGARRRRQGTGAFIAAQFARLGHSVCAIVGSDDASLAQAQRELRQHYDIRANTYADVKTLLGEEDIDVLVIASPDHTHLAYLEAAAQADCHVFCEKPLWWPADGVCPTPEHAEKTGNELVGRFDGRQKILHVNLQWPHTLPAFQTLYPAVSLVPDKIRQFAMRLSPQSSGSRMTVDSAPHPFSMLHQLLGMGEITGGHAHYDDAAHRALTLEFNYHHTRGDTAVTLTLKQHPEQPRPAGYAINGNTVERHVKLPDYLLSLASQDQSIPIQDPLARSVETFVNAVRLKQPNRRREIVAGMKHLCQLVCLSEQADT